MNVILTSAQFPEEKPLVAALFREYQQFLGIDLEFQSFESELAALPGKYAQPKGDIVLARVGEKVVGCISWYPLAPGIAEIKRLYVRPAARGLGAGKALFSHALEAIRESGYGKVRLDSLERLTEAAKLYETFGFRRIQPYNHNPFPDVYYMELNLA